MKTNFTLHAEAWKFGPPPITPHNSLLLAYVGGQKTLHGTFKVKHTATM